MANKDIEGEVEIKTTKGKAKLDTLTTGVKITGGAADLLRQVAQSTRDVQMQRAETVRTEDQVLWTAIRNRTEAIGFKAYSDFISRVFCPPGTRQAQPLCGDGRIEETAELESRLGTDEPTQFHGADAYRLLKAATETFLIFECGVAVRAPKNKETGKSDNKETIPKEAGRIGEQLSYQEADDALRLGKVREQLAAYLSQDKLPYLNRIVEALFRQHKPTEGHPFCADILKHRWHCPCLLELIWSFWHEEGMLVQTLNAISMRFQNRRGVLDHDPLAHLNLDPLRPMSNLIWGYIQDELNRLSLARRVYEYDHHYGLTLVGKAVPEIRSADSRSKFLEAFHNLLYIASRFYREDDDTTVIADAFAVLNALKEVHLVLAQGAHNQFGDLPWNARVEMLIQQWLLARPEFREFLSRPAMVPYKEDWMGAVDVMKQLQGWSDVTVTHFRDLAVYGEQILLSIRYGDWIDVNDPDQARNWARYWRPEVQSYMHSYRAVTGVDLTAELTDARQSADRYVQPAVHHAKRLELQRGQRTGEPNAPTNVRGNGAFVPARGRVTTP